MSAPSPIQAVLARFTGTPRLLPGGGYMVRCPAHPDRTPSLHISEGEGGRVLVSCQAGCDTEAVLAAAGLSVADLFAPSAPRRPGEPEAVYDYTDDAGQLLFQVVRWPGKRFAVRRPDGRGGWIPGQGDVPRPLYRLRRVRAGVRLGQEVWVAEGERDVEALEAAGMVATCNPGGAGKWLPEHAEALRGAVVTVFADWDDPGRRHAARVVRMLQGVAREVRAVATHHGKDAADHLAAGQSLNAVKVIEPEYLARYDDGATGEEDFEIVMASDAVMTPVRWLWNERLPLGMVSILAGYPGLGKSTLALWLAARVTRGELDGDEAGAALIFAAEDDWNKVSTPRLTAAGADLRRVGHFRPGIKDFLIPRDVKNGRMVRAARDIERRSRSPVRLLVFDPLVEFIDGFHNANDNKQTREALKQLPAVAELLGAAIVCIHHLNKGGALASGTGALERLSGSVAFGAAARTVLIVGTPEDDPDSRAVAVIKSNLGELPPPLRFEIESRTLANGVRTSVVSDLQAAPEINPERLDRRADTTEPRTKREQAKALLLERLAQGPVYEYELAGAAASLGISDRTLKRAKADLDVRHRPEGFQGRFVWELPGPPSACATYEPECAIHGPECATGQRAVGSGGPQSAPTSTRSTGVVEVDVKGEVKKEYLEKGDDIPPVCATSQCANDGVLWENADAPGGEP